MKTILAVCVSMIMWIGVMAQPSNVVSAWNYYKSGDLDKAKEMIDPAINHEKTKTWAKTWYFRGLIYQDLYNHKDFGKLDPDPLGVALIAFKKATEIDPKSEYAEDIELRTKRLGIQYFNKGLEEFKAKDFARALTSFESVLSLTPTDTSAVLNAAISADRSSNLEKAAVYYDKLIKMNYKDSKIFLYLSSIRKQQKDTAKAMEAVQQGRKLYPDDASLIKEELNFYLMTNRTDEAINSLNLALKHEPNNAILWFDLGTLYDRIGSESFKAGKSNETDPNFAKAEDAYRKAIDSKKDYFEAYYSIGAMYFNMAAEMNNAANDIDPNNTTAYEAAKVKFMAKFKQAQPFLEKALELQSTDRSTLISLKQLYARLDMPEKSEAMKKRLEGN